MAIVPLALMEKSFKKAFTKGTAIQLICQHYHASLQDTIAFGDSMNDSEMIQCAGIGIAMENACEELKNNRRYHLRKRTKRWNLP